MKTGWFTYVTLVALHKVCFPVTKGRKMHSPVKCEASSHTFYYLQAMVCMYCDACTERYSQFPATVIGLERNSKYRVTHGFTCRICKLGTNFDKRTFEFRCRTCRNCTTLWRVDKESERTHRSDAACGDTIEFLSIHKRQTSTDEVKTRTYQDPSSQNVILLILLSLLTLLFITTIFAVLCRAYNRASMRHCIKDATRGSGHKETLQCLNNFQPTTFQPSSSSESTAIDIHVPKENGETRQKGTTHNAQRNVVEHERRNRPPSLYITTESTIEPEFNCSSWNLGASDLISRTQFTVGNTNIALSRSVICQFSDRRLDSGNEDQSLEMFSQFSPVLELRY